ncbi:MAG: VOC family protein, partial [Caldilineaceae bacterium]|nr:VOC family protein [Caldilineaceae bacterium]
MFFFNVKATTEFYTATFPDSEIRNVARAGEDGPISSAE